MPQLVGTVHFYTGFAPSHLHRRSVVLSGVVRAGRVVREENRIGTIGANERVEVFAVERAGAHHHVSSMPYYVWAFDLSDTNEPAESPFAQADRASRQMAEQFTCQTDN